jgi:response regulator of citrate/malate metabolism
MDTATVAVVTVPIGEWNETKAMLKSISEQVEQLTNKDKKELLTPKEVCQELKIGRTTFERYVINGVFDPVRVNKQKYSKIYIRRADMERLVNEGKI